MANKRTEALQQTDVEEYHGCFTGTVITSPHRCTATDSSPCHIIGQIAVCNELLYSVQLELREHSPRDLHLGSLECGEPNSESGYEINQAFCLLSCLLKNHRCIVSINIKPWNFFLEYEAMISSSYRPTPELKSLTVAGHLWVVGGKELLIQTVARTLPFLTGLEELHCVLFENPHNLIEPLCCLLEKSSALKKLMLFHRNITPREASLFCCALSKAYTLTELSINWRCVMPEGGNYSMAFAASLEKSTILKTLAISGDDYRLEKLKLIIYAVGRSKSLENLSLNYFLIDNELSVAIEDLLTGNCSLRSFSMKECEWYRKPGEADNSYFSTDAIDVLSTRIGPWINILQKNRSLEELRLNLAAFSPTDCRAFFSALKNNTSLKRVLIEDIGFYFYLRGIATWSGSSQNKIEGPPPDRPDVIITQCQQLSSIHLWLGDKQDIPWFKMAVSALSSSIHVTKLGIDTRLVRMRDEVEELIADYIKNTIALKELRLGLPRPPYNVTKCPACRMKIIEALRDNASVRKLLLANEAFTEDEAVEFAAMLISSNKIYDFEIATSAKSIEALVNHLCPRFSRNYTLVSLRCIIGGEVLEPDLPGTIQYYCVRNIVRRNHDLITRAVHCVTGNSNRNCTEALEIVADNPALIVKVCELQSVGEMDAAQMVRNSLGTLLGLDDFMRIAGVVKSRVSCPRSDDRKLQLEDLDEYSWLKVRRHLRISDVLARPLSP